MNSDREFDGGMFDLQMATTKAAIHKVQHLRTENAELRRQSAAHAGEVWALQQRIELLEQQLRAAIGRAGQEQS